MIKKKTWILTEKEFDKLFLEYSEKLKKFIKDENVEWSLVLSQVMVDFGIFGLVMNELKKGVIMSFAEELTDLYIKEKRMDESVKEKEDG